MEAVVQVEGLVKRFGALTAVDNVSFSVARGEVFGILGPNGAGKTTTLEILEGLQQPTAGRTVVLGADTHKNRAQVKERIGVQLQASAYFDYLTLSEILELFGRFYRNRVPPQQLLDLVSLQDKAHTVLRKLSGGQKQRFTVAASLVNDPELVVLDEPTTGLDPQARRSLWELIQQIHARGKTIILTTHYMEEAEVLCDRVAIMNLGRIIALDTPATLVRSLNSPYLIKVVTSKALPLDEMGDLGSSAEDLGPAAGGAAYRFRVTNGPRAVSNLVTFTSALGIAMEHLEVTTATLEDVFLQLTGRRLQE